MIGISVLLGILFVFSTFQLMALKRELKNIRVQLEAYITGKTDKKIDVVFLNKEIENLGLEINNLIDLYVSENRALIRFKEEQKQTIVNISHDLRTPLTSILGYIQLAENEVTSEEGKELLKVAKERANRLEVLLKDFFELSIIESSGYQLKSERINIKSFVIERLMNVFDEFNHHGLEPVIEMPDEELYILGDSSAVTRVIDNLLSNAMKYSDGHVLIRLENNQLNVRFIIQNDAKSLKAEDVEHLFDRFYMADRARSGKSTGLGLSIVKSFMEKMNGNVTADLNDGKLTIVCKWNIA